MVHVLVDLKKRIVSSELVKVMVGKTREGDGGALLRLRWLHVRHCAGAELRNSLKILKGTLNPVPPTGPSAVVCNLKGGFTSDIAKVSPFLRYLVSVPEILGE